MAVTADGEAEDETGAPELPAYDPTSELTWTEQPRYASDPVRAFGWTLLWSLGIAFAAGACGGFAFLIGDDDIAGAAVLAAVVGGGFGLFLAVVPGIVAAIALAVAAHRAATDRGYRRWVGGTVLALALLVPLVAHRVYFSFTAPRGSSMAGIHRDPSFARGLIVAFVVAELLLIAMWRSLRTIRDEDDEDVD